MKTRQSMLVIYWGTRVIWQKTLFTFISFLSSSYCKIFSKESCFEPKILWCTYTTLIKTIAFCDQFLLRKKILYSWRCLRFRNMYRLSCASRKKLWRFEFFLPVKQPHKKTFRLTTLWLQIFAPFFLEVQNNPYKYASKSETALHIKMVIFNFVAITKLIGGLLLDMLSTFMTGSFL